MFNADHMSALGFGSGGATYLGNHMTTARGAADLTEIEYLQNELRKALVASEGVTDPASLTQVGALMPEELDAEITYLTMREQHLTLWKDLQALFEPVKNTIHQYIVQTGHGTEASFTRQMELPLEDEPDWARGIGYLKFLRTLYKTGDIAMQVRTVKNPEAANRESAMIRLLRTFEWAMINGNSALMPEMPDGIQTTIRAVNNSNNLIDMRGLAPTIDVFEGVTQTLRENFSTAPNWRLYCSTGGRVTLDQIQRSRDSAGTIERFIPTGVGQSTYNLGSMLGEIVTGNGNLIPRANMMMGAVLEAMFPPVRGDSNDPAGAVIESATSVRAPDTPTAVVTVQAPTVAGSKWTDSDLRPSGATYKYRVTAVNRWGKSAASVLVDAGADVLAGGSITITITPSGVGEPADYYEIYGQFAEGDEATHGNRRAFTVIGRKKANGNNAVPFVDLNEIYPRHTSYFILDTTTRGPDATLSIGQLLPVINQPLAKVGPYIESYITMTMMPMYRAPLRMVEIYNVPVRKVAMSDRSVV